MTRKNFSPGRRSEGMEGGGQRPRPEVGGYGGRRAEAQAGGRRAWRAEGRGPGRRVEGMEGGGHIQMPTFDCTLHGMNHELGRVFYFLTSLELHNIISSI